MQALIVIDAQNEFSHKGKRPVPNYLNAIDAIKEHVRQARTLNTPIAWVRHFNKPDESPAFIPGTWGSEFYPDMGPASESDFEKEFQKNVYGAFTGSDIGHWLRDRKVTEVLITGFYTHGCVSTTAREAIMLGLKVYLNIDATGTCDISHESLGTLTADEVRRSTLLQLVNMGASILNKVRK